MRTKKTLKLSVETIRRLDLDAATGGYHHQPLPNYSRFGSCGIGCTFTTDPGLPPTRSFGPTCGFGCTTFGPRTAMSCGVAICF
jgi:hypothetical protein